MSESVAGRRAGSSRYFVLLVLVNMMWAFQYTGARIATRKLGSVTVTLLPMAMATVFLGLLLFCKRGAKAKQPSRERSGFGRHLFEFVALGLGGCFVGQFCLTSGVSRSLASNASVITLVIPVLTAFLATLLVGEKMSRLLWVSFAMAIGGVLLVSDVDWRTVHIFHGKYLAGNALILVGCCGSAFYNAFSKRLLRAFTPLEVLVYSFIVTDLALLVVMLVREPLSWRQLASLGFEVWLSLAMIAFLCLTSAMLLFFWVIQRVDLTHAALSIYLLPVFGVLISTVTLHEKIRWQLLAGGFLVFLGAFLATKLGERQTAR